MNKDRIKSLVEILKTTVKELEQEMTDTPVVLGGSASPPRDAIDRLDLSRNEHMTFPSGNSVDKDHIEPSKYKVNYSDILSFYNNDSHLNSWYDEFR